MGAHFSQASRQGGPLAADGEGGRQPAGSLWGRGLPVTPLPRGLPVTRCHVVTSGILTP